MPNPLTGSGADISKGLRKYSWALYLAPASGGAVAPPGKLVGAEAAAPWVRQGRLKGDEFAWNVGAPQFLEGRAGFKKVLKFYVVNQAELPKVTVPLDESDPEILNRLRGGAAGAATTLSSGVYEGYKFVYDTGIFYSAKVLLVGTGVNGTFERQVIGLNAVVLFKFVTNPDSEGVELDVTFLNDSNNDSFTVQDWD